MSTLGERQHQQIRDYELRHGAAIGVPNRNLIMPRPKEGKHARLSMRVRAAGDQWVLMIKDQTGPGRHRVGLSVEGITALVNGTHPRVDPR
ncbi:hypothetical protein SEA_WALELIANO_76 [Mycobacterium phage Waleliano]|uniref:Uncharacterized protein n=2 Tax=Coopervirus brownCNA TaxID=1983108 RepID=A0A0K1Y6R4_9CAUD|nr:HNH endonuclease [Mycobacterium phage BrownCNA]AKY02791.1 hypothetical protein SEA_BROWNCNA_78 [Mycobacterium phage BrownCNA]QBI96144.1 hypothetical protein SEA_WALELIANO_76 [Mycobacterium phage Waleliano]